MSWLSAAWHWYATEAVSNGAITYPHAGLVNPVVAGVGAALLVGAALQQAATARRRHKEQTDADRQRRITESFSKAVEQLASDKIEARLGGIYTLERISRESSDDYWIVMETLCAFVREREPWKVLGESSSDTVARFYEKAETAENRSDLSTDVAAVLAVIVRRDEKSQQRESDNRWRLDFRGADLRRANLSSANLSGANFSGANLRKADLSKAGLRNANLHGASLAGANLSGADLSGAKLFRADLPGAFLFGANLSGANLSEAVLSGADLRKADLSGAKLVISNLSKARLSDANLSEAALSGVDFIGANLSDANLKGANLRGGRLAGARPFGADETELSEPDRFPANQASLSRIVKVHGANFRGVDLSRVHGLTAEQLAQALGDAKTRLPAGIPRPECWPQEVKANEPPVEC